MNINSNSNQANTAMNNQRKLVKFTMLVKEIGGRLSYWNEETYGKPKANPLKLIFDTKSANDYLRIILRDVFCETSKEWYERYAIPDFNELNVKIAATKEFIECIRETDNREDAVTFIFWSLFGLSVDKTNYDEKVSLIADFAHMLKIDDKTLKDIAQVIKVILGEEENLKFETDEVPAIFAKILFNDDDYLKVKYKGIFSLIDKIKEGKI